MHAHLDHTCVASLRSGCSPVTNEAILFLFTDIDGLLCETAPLGLAMDYSSSQGREEIVGQVAQKAAEAAVGPSTHGVLFQEEVCCA